MDSASPSLRARRDRIARTWSGEHSGPTVVASGLPVAIAGTDQYHDFHAHPDFAYLSGAAYPGSLLAFDPREGWNLFVPLASIDDRIWVGDGESLEGAATTTGIERPRPLSALASWLESHRGEPLAVLGNHDILQDAAAYGIRGWAPLEPELDVEASARLTERIAESRRTKDPSELSRMRAAANATAAGHRAAFRLARPGMTERALQVEVEAEFFRNGAARTAYGSIVGGGPNGAVLHFSPTARPFADGEIVLMDAAAEYEGYAADVTRTFPVGERFSGIQRDLYALVLGVQQQAVHDARPGVEYRDLHLAASLRIAEGLVSLGILRGSPADLVEQDVHALFFPHGLGHMLGLATHDAGGCLAGRTPSDRFGLKWLRADLPLQPGHVVTIEPGVYFIRALLTDPFRRSRYASQVNWDMVEQMLDFGGIRIEDDVLVTADGPEMLTASIPRELEEIEELRREGLRG